MSEMPEIESIVYFLSPHLCGREIKNITVNNESILVNRTREQLTAVLIGRKITGITRRGKIFIVTLSDESKLYIHPRMVGQLITCPQDFPEIKHTHFIMQLDNNEEFRYIDVRRLGKIYHLSKDEDISITGIHKLGFEYDDSRLDEKYLQQRFQKYKKTVKEALLDQSIIAGIGNIYADEILFQAGILPTEKACTLNEVEIRKLLTSVHETLEKYIAINESAGYEKYLKGEGRDFENMHSLRLYDMEECPVCKGQLQRIKIASRGTVYCPHCQK